ncbi:unnamed protein product [Arctia plantaginis]|uniref:Uncharacterized protein n=1 Tax=Arctia plantaginis TaxID=874455 RepID=A0A8S0YW62_ARCPL|nr:unnamed protein product [Arctia plantaginis]
MPISSRSSPRGVVLQKEHEHAAETPSALRESFGQLPRSASIDSMVEAAICARHSEPSPPTTLQIPRADRAFSLASPVVGRRAKTQRGQAGELSLKYYKSFKVVEALIKV